VIRLTRRALVVVALLSATDAGAAGPVPARGADAAKAFDRFLAEVWEEDLTESPLLASQVGDTRYADRLPDDSIEGHRRRAALTRRQLERLARIDRAALPRAAQISHEMLEREKRDALADFEHHAYETPITNREGFHISFAGLPGDTVFRTPADYDAYVRRLLAFETWVGQQIACMRLGMKDGHVLPRVVLLGYDESIRAHVSDDPEKTVFFGPCRTIQVPMDDDAKARVARSCRDAIAKSVVPGYRAFLDFMTKEYIPACRQTVGASALPRGAELYAHRVRHYTTLDITADEVHRIGLAEVDRILAEMDAVRAKAGFTGSRADFFAFLRTDPRFYVTTPDDLLKETALVCKRMDGELPRLFRRLPRTPYGIRPIPDFIAEKTTGAYYDMAAGDGSRAGTYRVNTSRLASRPLYVIEALSFHESVPGHHLQIALQQELTGLPAFRRFGGVDAFVEGWALYAERLGLETGFYTDPYRDFGRLTYEIWRACRLVVDTGLHAKGWSREQALDYMATRTALSLHEVTTEIDRYIAWPGQALAYKMGELRIRTLRKKAEDALGPAFDVREFHDVVLRNGAVPLPVLEAEVDAYLAAARSARTVAR